MGAHPASLSLVCCKSLPLAFCANLAPETVFQARLCSSQLLHGSNWTASGQGRQRHLRLRLHLQSREATPIPFWLERQWPAGACCGIRAPQQSTVHRPLSTGERASEQLDETAVLAVAQPSDGSLPISRLGWRLGLSSPGRSGQIWRALIWACELGEKFDMEGVHFEAALLERAGQRWAEGEKRRVPL